MLITIKDFEKKFIEKGLSFTSQRKTIAEVIISLKSHLDIEEIFLEVKKVDKTASIATVYRTINLFTEIGLLIKLDFKDKKSRYELKPEKEHNHIILNTGEIIEFESKELEKLIHSITTERGLTLTNYNIELYCIK